MKHLISFATGPYVEAQSRLLASAQPYFDRIKAAALPSHFTENHREHFRYTRGYGWWIWKPWLIRRCLDVMAADDVVMYCDSQLVFVADPKPLFELCEKNGGVLIFHQKGPGYRNREWTKRDAFVLMGCDEERYWNAYQANAAMSVWMNTAAAWELLDEWYKWVSNLRVVSDAPSMTPNFPEFREHRHDQSIIGILAEKHGITTYPDPSQWGDGVQQHGREYGRVVEMRRYVKNPYPIPCLEPTQ